MAKRHKLHLSHEQLEDLRHLRDTGEPAYLRERAAALLKIGELAKLPIEILQLPTYASWTNRIEKLWRWVRQSVLDLHRLANDWQALQQRVMAFMQQFRGGSEKLLRYVRLLPD